MCVRRDGLPKLKTSIPEWSRRPSLSRAMSSTAIPVQQMSALARFGRYWACHVTLTLVYTCLGAGSSHYILVCVEFLAGGEVAAVDATPDTTIGEFKGLILQTLRPDDDELTRRVSLVELVQGKKRLHDDVATLAESGVSSDAGVMAVISKRLVKLRRKDDAPDDQPYDLNDPDRPVVLEIPRGTTEVSDDAFPYCWSVVSVTIPDSVTRIGERAFSHCNSLTTLTIPESVTAIRNGAFADCSSLTSLTMPESVSMIDDWVFYGCISLTTLTIPKSVTTIGNALAGCTSLRKLGLPVSLQNRLPFLGQPSHCEVVLC